jgi:hypothetical protein
VEKARVQVGGIHVLHGVSRPRVIRREGGNPPIGILLKRGHKTVLGGSKSGSFCEKRSIY